MAYTSQDGDLLYEDLYEDLGGGKHVLKTSIQEMEERLELLTKGKKELESKLELMQKKVEATEQEKNVLIRNISCLFKTAQLEIGRKDKQIQKLQEDVLSLKSQTYLAGPKGFLEKQHQKDYNESSHHIPQLQENKTCDTVHAEEDMRASQNVRGVSWSRSSQVKMSEAEEWREEGQIGCHNSGCSPTKRSKKDKQDILDRRDRRYGFDDKRYNGSCQSKADQPVQINGYRAPRRHSSDSQKL